MDSIAVSASNVHPRGFSYRRIILLPIALSVFASCGTRVAVKPQTRAEAYASVIRMSEIGRKLFFDPTLSASGRLACVSCHDPNNSFTPANPLPVQTGGFDMQQPGIRAVPTLKYLQSVPAFSEHFHESEDEGDESVDAGPTGGLMWDGRVDRPADQAKLPLISEFEMDSTPRKVAKAVRASAYAKEFETAFGKAIFKSDAATFIAVLKALEAFEQTAQLFYPYSSKYDAYLAGKAELSASEERGLRLFNDEEKANCNSCHVSSRAKNGAPPQFTDFALVALGVPRNRQIPRNRDPNFFDLGACGPIRLDLKNRPEFCGLFRTPTLRNVALKKSFFHNGIYHSLQDVLRFYAERDTNPEDIYPAVNGRPNKFDDLPEAYWANVNLDPPFGHKHGREPVLTENEAKDIIDFLNTLTDGWNSDGLKTLSGAEPLCAQKLGVAILIVVPAGFPCSTFEPRVH